LVRRIQVVRGEVADCAMLPAPLSNRSESSARRDKYSPLACCLFQLRAKTGGPKLNNSHPRPAVRAASRFAQPTSHVTSKTGTRIPCWWSKVLPRKKEHPTAPRLTLEFVPPQQRTLAKDNWDVQQIDEVSQCRLRALSARSARVALTPRTSLAVRRQPSHWQPR
jgi:hypothetical protein